MFRGLLFFIICLFSLSKVSASGGLVVDAELDSVIRDLVRPLIEVSGLEPDKIEFLVINDPKINAHTAENKIFINTGLLLLDDDPAQFLGVLAHEIGHLAFSHNSKIRAHFKKSVFNALIGSALGIIAAVATGRGEALLAASAVQSFVDDLSFSYSREQERIADQAALKYLRQAGYPIAGLRKLLIRIRSSSDLLQVYGATHPLPDERIVSLNNQMVAGIGDSDSGLTDEYRKRFKRIFYKLYALLYSSGHSMKFSGNEDIDKYAASVSHYMVGESADALRLVDSLLSQEENNEYYNELKAAVLTRMGRLKEAVVFCEKAIALNNNPIVVIDGVKIMLSVNDREVTKRAVRHLEQLLANSDSMFLIVAKGELAHGYAILGEKGKSYIMLIEKSIDSGALKEAKDYLTLAKKHVIKGSVEEARLHDLESFLGNKGEGFMSR